jgi:hypothetical protein
MAPLPQPERNTNKSYDKWLASTRRQSRIDAALRKIVKKAS